MPTLHRDTLQLAVLVSFAFSALALTLTWRINRAVAGPRWWMAGAWLAIAGVVAVPSALRLGLPRAAGIAVNNVISPLVFLLALLGVLRFRGHVLARRTWTLVAAGVAGLVVAAVTLREQAIPRHLWHDGIAIALLVALAVALVRGTRGEERRIHAAAAGLMLLPVVGFAARWLVAWRGPDDATVAAHPIQNVLGLVYLVFSVGWTYAATLVLYERSQLALRAQARTDGLTGLPNRRAFDEALAREAQRAPRGGGGFALLLLDLNGFKAVNDVHGHAAGDALLVAVGSRLQRWARDGDVVARLGGDEFAVLVHGVADEGQLAATADRLRGALDGPAAASGAVVPVQVSLGGALWPGDAMDAEGLLHAADVRMYADKGARRRRRATDLDAPASAPSR